MCDIHKYNRIKKVLNNDALSDKKIVEILKKIVNKVDVYEDNESDNIITLKEGKYYVKKYFTNIFDEKLTINNFCNNNNKNEKILIKSLSHKFINLTELDIIDAEITTLPSTLANLVKLSMEGSNILYIPETYINLTYLNAYSVDIYDLPDTLINLTELLISENHVEYIPKSLDKLKYLVCNGTLISKISSKFTELITLECWNNNYLNKIPNTLINLKKLECHYNPCLNKIPNTLINLIYLNCSGTEILEIPDTLINLKLLCMSGTKIKYLPHTLINLYAIDCERSKLLYIPNTYKKLRKLHCENLFFKEQKKPEDVCISNIIYYSEMQLKGFISDEYYKNEIDFNNPDIIARLYHYDLNDYYYENDNYTDLKELYKTFIKWQRKLKKKCIYRKCLKMLYNPKYIGGYLAKTRINKLF